MNCCLLVTSDTFDASHQTQTTCNTNDSFCIIYTWLCSVFRLRLSTMRSTLGVFSLRFQSLRSCSVLNSSWSKSTHWTLERLFGIKQARGSHRQVLLIDSSLRRVSCVMSALSSYLQRQWCLHKGWTLEFRVWNRNQLVGRVNST